MNPLNSIKAVWRDPKKRPWLIAGGGAAATAGFMAMKRPVEPSDQVGEESAAQSAAPEGGGGYPGEYVYGGTLPPVYALGGMGGDFDSGMAETDLSSVWAELDGIEARQQEAIGAAVGAERDARKKAVATQKARTQKVRTRVEKQTKVNRKQRQQIARLKRRVQNKPKPKPRSKTKAKAGR